MVGKRQSGVEGRQLRVVVLGDVARPDSAQRWSVQSLQGSTSNKLIHCNQSDLRELN
jgi:hypothetical protein